MSRISFFVPGIPTGKKRPRFARHGRHVVTYKDKADARRENMVALAYREAAGNREPHTGPVVFSMDAVFLPPQRWPNKRKSDPGSKTSKPDLDNIEKSVIDGLKGVAFVDDAQIVGIHSGKRYGPMNEIIVAIDFI